jgi:hypothetical protein
MERKYPPETVEKICRQLATGTVTQRRAAELSGISQSRISVWFAEYRLAHPTVRACEWCGGQISLMARTDKRFCSAACLGEHARWGHLSESEMIEKFFRERDCAKPGCLNSVPLPARPDRRYCDDHVRRRRAVA